MFSPAFRPDVSINTLDIFSASGIFYAVALRGSLILQQHAHTRWSLMMLYRKRLPTEEVYKWGKTAAMCTKLG